MMPPGGMDPEMMKIAMEQMKNMTPEQLEAMKAQAANMSPEAMQSAMNMMKNAKPEDLKREMQNNTMPSDPAVLQQQVDAFEQRVKSESEMKYNASLGLKGQGNAFFTQKKYAEAREKYVKAAENLVDLPSAEAKKLLQTCYLNNAACCLNLDKHEECVDCCSKVEKIDANAARNLKLFYRRGQAYTHLGKLKLALTDLRRAKVIAPADKGVTAALQKAVEEYEKVEAENQRDDYYGAGEAADEDDGEAGDVEEISFGFQEEGFGAEEEVAAPAAAATAGAAGAAAAMGASMGGMEMPGGFPGGFPGGMPGMPGMMPGMMPPGMGGMDDMMNMGGMGAGPALTPEQEAKLKLVMEDPEAMKKVTEALSKMTDEDFKKIGEASGMANQPNFNPEMMRQAGKMMADMNPEQMEQMMSMGGASTSGPTQEQMDSVMKNPELMKMSSNMMQQMSDEDFKSMAKMSGLSEDQVNPETLKKGAAAMAKMKPEEIEKITKLAQVDAKDGKTDAMDKLQKVAEVLSTMSAESVSVVALDMGYEMSEKQAAWMLRFLGIVAVILKFIIAMKNFIVKRKLLVLAFLVLLVALYFQRR
mmetsp:Transcript_17138/g.38758  ORF Transcript_17138/g.38758 Transcript_17138/m.38758 type:complete len:587 (-) Transcript_17138:5-1765(-)